MTAPTPLQEAIRAAAVTLTPGHLLAMADAVEHSDGWHPTAVHRAHRKVVTPVSRQHATAICQAWHDTDAQLSGAAVALGLRTAAATAEAMRSQQSVELVWTGPDSHEVPVRLTADALREVILAAHNDLLLLSFSSFAVRDLIEDLSAAATRGVTITVVLETRQESRGKLSSDAIAAYQDLEGSRLYVWPSEKRPEVGRGVALMHAKAAIADDQQALVGSANLTGAALESNMELGIMLTGGAIPRLLADHYRQLMADGVLVPVTAESLDV